MACRNLFEEKFNQVSEPSKQLENVRIKVLEGARELNELKKICNNKHKELTEVELEVSKLKNSNRDLRISLMKKLIEKAEVENRKRDVSQRVDELNQKVDVLEEEAKEFLSGRFTETFCSRFDTAQQISLMNKIQDATGKLVEYGFQPYSS